ncbi:adenylate/guanylate cyclase domain-containing protein [Candidatus Ichthyocystis hellenicum]|uniref:adenylate/guanylate cyclase domain-containing protein n=1 Tax=Candidatus Ichthyocystis hellenicum TaxID=1561003 RepID=UPI001F5F3691|nr:adenylate/guanylate cyclase domain-containing protein [Candidatus Ichthyocystis hellenicum]
MLSRRQKPPYVLLHVLSSIASAAQALLIIYFNDLDKVSVSLKSTSEALFVLSITNTIIALIVHWKKKSFSFPNQRISLLILWSTPLIPMFSNQMSFIHLIFSAPWAMLFVTYSSLFHPFRNKIAWLWAYTFSLVVFMSAWYLKSHVSPATAAATMMWQIPYQQNLILLFSVSLIMYSTHAKHQNIKLKKVISQATAEIEERLKTEEILLNTLPLRVILRLKKGEQIIADRFGHATILFADLVGFTQIAHKVAPSQLFRMINKIFLEFDKITNEKYLEKIKTNGDSYMVAGGISPESPNNPSLAAVELALKMKTIIEELSRQNPHKLQLRVGISTGPVVAGVLGSRKFIFDVWGDTVNIASRLSNEGNPQSILVDETTYNLCQKPELFDEPREIWLKGKGKCLAYPLKQAFLSR